MRPREVFNEVAPRVFDVALYYASALARGGFSTALRDDRVAGLGIEELGADALPAAARRAVQHLTAGRHSVIQSFLCTTAMPCGDPSSELDDPERCAVLDAAVGGERWFLAARLYWLADSFSDTAGTRRHDQIVIAVEGPEAARVLRLRFDDAQGILLRRMVREALLRDVVLRPSFGLPGSRDGHATPLAPAGDDHAGGSS